jgi:hypothetical protein
MTSLKTLADTVGLLTDQQMVELAAELAALPPRRSLYMGETPQAIADSAQDQVVLDGAENPLWEIVRLMPARPYWGPGGRLEPDGYWATSLDVDSMRRAHAAGLGRSELCARYSWSIPSPGDVAWLVQLLAGRAVVEIGAGSGYWAWQLAQAGIDVAAYDPHPPGPENNFNQHRLYHPVAEGDHECAADHPDRALMLCWPSYGAEFAKQALHHYQGDTVVYIGESEGGCCADDRFHRILARDYDEAGRSPFHVTYWGIHCELTVWRRKAVQGAEPSESGPR